MTQELETALVLRNGAELPALIGDPEQQIADATRAAKALKKVVDQGNLSKRIGQSDHLQFEAWQTVGHFYGITAKIESTHRDDDGAWYARAVTLRHGDIIGAAESSCSPDEENWKDKPAFQLQSMAQTRTMGKALRSVLAFVVVLAGYNPTPAEEMTGVKQPAQKAPPDVSKVAACGHGERVWKAGKNKAGKPYRGWFCPKGADGCTPVWVAESKAIPERDVNADSLPADKQDDPAQLTEAELASIEAPYG